MPQVLIARCFEIQGIVQGVGFRPHVHYLALKYKLTGNVSNTAAGVVIQVQGSPDVIATFQKDLVANPPPLAHIAKVTVSSISPLRTDAFTIIPSDANSERSALIAPDTSVCEDCLKEMFDPADRRYRYPFINCTNCGPRYTIIDDIPYDRPQTSMRNFTMGSDCQAEYDTPDNRRFHAQPNACPTCGPGVQLFDSSRRLIHTQDPVNLTKELLAAGHIVAIKGLGGYHLAVDATNEASVSKLRQLKNREEKPLALMASDVSAIRRFAQVDTTGAETLVSRQRPIVLLPKRYTSHIANSVAPHSREFGVMLPYTPLHYLLFENTDLVLVMTSGNRSDDPIAIENDDAFERLHSIAEYFLIHNRDILLRSDDSLVRVTDHSVQFMRRSRGYVPVPIFLKRPLPPILAVGAALKNTICLTKENRAFVSQHIGDLENVPTYRFFEQTIDHMTRILSIDPTIVAHDYHPDYLSTRYVQQLNIEKVAVQHHHAHIVSVMAEHGLDGPVLGLAFDGTGYGDDGHIWGGELLLATPAEYKRMAHLAYIPMPGSNAAIKSPWRMAVSYLYATFGNKLWGLDIPFIHRINSNKTKATLQMIDRKLNSPLTSSIGRLFDGVAALVGVRNDVTFEGQAAMELEHLSTDIDTPYSYDWETDGDQIKIRPEGIIRDIVTDLAAKQPVPKIAGRFHATLIDIFGELTAQIGSRRGINIVVLSGGVFQNIRLIKGIRSTLYAKGLNVYTPKSLPANDGGISLGQAMVAAAKKRPCG